MKKELLIIFLFSVLICFGQSEKKYQQILSSNKSDSVLVFKLNELDNKIYFDEPELSFKINLFIDSLIDINLGQYKTYHFRKYKMHALSNIGGEYLYKGNYYLAINYLTNALRLAEIDSNINSKATILNNIGLIHDYQNNLEESIDYLTRSLEIFVQLNDSINIANLQNNIGTVSRKLKKYKTAKELFENSLKIRELIKDTTGIATSLSNLGNIFSDKKQHSKALEYYHRSLKLSQLQNDAYSIPLAYSNIGSVYLNQKDYENSIAYNLKGLKLANELDFKEDISAINRDLYLCYKSLGDQKNALKFYEAHVSVKDSLINLRNKEAILKNEFRFQYERKVASDSIKRLERDKIERAERELNEIKYENQRIEFDQMLKEKQQNKVKRYYLYAIIILVLLAALFILNRYRLIRKQKAEIEEKKSKVEEQREEIDRAYNELGEKNSEIIDSINYAKRIQTAILPSEEKTKKFLPNGFIIYEPKDIVAGDFYWIEKKHNHLFVAAADCTGHGVPGAMVSVICNNALNKAVKEKNLIAPGEILNDARNTVIEEFSGSEESVKDGMDIALVSLNGNSLCYAGAHNPLWIVNQDSDELIEIKANKMPIGDSHNNEPFTSHTVEISSGARLYIFSDGYADQFGGPKGKKMKTSRFKKLILESKAFSLEDQKKFLQDQFQSWKGALEQLDDVCVICIEIN